MNDQAIRSPDGLQLRSTPLASARLNKKAVLTMIGALAVILGVVIANVSKSRPVKGPEQMQAKALQPALNEAKDLTKNVPDIVTPPPVPTPSPVQQAEPRVVRSAPKDPDEDARLADTAIPKFKTQRQDKEFEFEAASEERPSAGLSSQAASLPDAATSPQAGVNSSYTAAAVAAALRMRSTAASPDASGSGGESDLNQQSEKDDFLKKEMESDVLRSRLRPPVSRFELQAGTVIPATLLTAINSDLPGEIVAQVAQNVYDSATGQYLLVPQGSRLFGHYDSKVAFGQGRALVSWQRLTFPNAYTLDLGAMSGHDSGGQSGLADQVNHHYGRIFGWALLTSALSATAQLSQPQQTNSLIPSNGQVAAAAVGQQMSNLGAQIASRNLQVQPTIEIRKGYRLVVMVNKDVVFPGSYAP